MHDRLTVGVSPEVWPFSCRDGSNCTGQRLWNHKTRAILTHRRLSFLIRGTSHSSADLPEHCGAHARHKSPASNRGAFFFYDARMPRVQWFLVLVIALQLCLGGVWASPRLDRGEAQQMSDAARLANAHCHEESGVASSAVPDSANTATQDPGLSGCSASHCNLCSATGLPIHTIATVVCLPDTPNSSTAAPMLVSWVLPPELRPPI